MFAYFNSFSAYFKVFSAYLHAYTGLDLVHIIRTIIIIRITHSYRNYYKRKKNNTQQGILSCRYNKLYTLEKVFQ